MPGLFYSCQYCKHITSKKVNIYRHIIKNHSDHLPFYCETCGKPFPGRHELSAHVKYIHNVQKKKRDAVFAVHSPTASLSDTEADEEAIKRSLDCDKKPPRVTKHLHCWKCNVGMPTRIGLNDHIMLVHYGMKNFRCESCNKSFEMTAILKKHMTECHDSLLSYPCRYCMDTAFPDKTRLFQHYRDIHPDNPAVQFFRGTDSTMLLNYIPSLIMEGAKNHFTVYAPVITRCSKASAKLAEYKKAVLADNVASIFSTLGFVDNKKSDTNLIDCSSTNLRTESGPIATRSPPSVCDQPNDLVDLPTNFTTLCQDAASTLPVCWVKLEKFEAADIKFEPVDNQECDDMPADVDPQMVKDELRADATSYSYDDYGTVNEKVESPSTHQVDFTDNHLSGPSPRDEMAVRTKSVQTKRRRTKGRQPRSRQPHISNNSLYKSSEDEQEEPMDTDGEDQDSNQRAKRIDGETVCGMAAQNVNYGFGVVKKCNHCEHMCPTKLMASHIREKHGGRDIKQNYFEDGFQCSSCSFSTKWRKNLKDHILALHSPDAAVHKCNQCSYSTHIIKYLRRHVKIKHGVKRFVCSQCSTAFCNVSDLRDHVAVQHEGRLRHQCTLCSFTAGYRSSLCVHMKKCHKCPQCKYTHRDQNELARHMAEEHGIVSHSHAGVLKKRNLSQPVSTIDELDRHQPVVTRIDLGNGCTMVLHHRPRMFNQMMPSDDNHQQTLDSRVGNGSMLSSTLSADEDQRIAEEESSAKSNKINNAAKIINESHKIELLPTAIREDLDPEPYYCL